MDTLKKIARMLEIIDSAGPYGYYLCDGAEWEEFAQLDAEVCGECNYLGVSMPKYSISVQHNSSPPVAFGFVAIARSITNLGWTIRPREEWRQAMRGLQAAVRVALERRIDAADIATAKTQPDIANYAKANFGKRPSERSIQNWIADRSLRAQLRGQLWEFSKSDLRTLVLGKSE